jgi:hypothetical protein
MAFLATAALALTMLAALGSDQLGSETAVNSGRQASEDLAPGWLTAAGW